MAIPRKVEERLSSTLRKYLPVLQAQRDRDVSEADTVTLVKDVLSDVFGFDKYAELTGEFAIRGTRCDLAVKLDGKLRALIEVKAIGLELNDRHVKQTVDYAANQGVEWVVLTNGVRWILYHVLFKQPIDKEEVANIDLLSVNVKKENDLDKLFLLTREGITRDALTEYRDRKDATSRFTLAAILVQSDSVIAAIRKEVRRGSEILVDPEVIVKVLRDEVIKRELLEGEQADDARRRYQRSAGRVMRQRRSKDDGCADEEVEPASLVDVPPPPVAS